MNYFEQETERLQLRKLTTDDIESWVSFFENNEKLPYVGVDLNKDARTLATEWINMQLKRYKEQDLGHLAVVEKASGDFMGTAGILPRTLEGQPELEIAYSLKQEFWGKGYGTEAATQLKSFGIQHNLASRFISIIDKRNAASIRVAQKNNMTVLFETHYMGMDVFVFGEERGV